MNVKIDPSFYIHLPIDFYGLSDQVCMKNWPDWNIHVKGALVVLSTHSRPFSLILLLYTASNPFLFLELP